jgi:hypothetical protein
MTDFGFNYYGGVVAGRGLYDDFGYVGRPGAFLKAGIDPCG